MFDDTICAIITALGGAVGIVRLSGPEAVAVGEKVWRGRQTLGDLTARTLALGEVRDASGRVLDPECLAVKMPGPHSYTGEDVVELQCHGGALCVRLALEAVLAAGARLAEPGEFTRRAFLNGRLDLTQAEAVADVISAGSTTALRMAGRQLKGVLGRKVNTCYEQLSDILADIESRLDFPEEEIDWNPAEDLIVDLRMCHDELESLLKTQKTGEMLRGGVGMAIVGRPNVGKSSLLNCLLGRERAIVTDIPGTTRDTLEERVVIRDIPIRLVDTAGIRDGGDVIERTGMERAQESAEGADVVLWVFDGSLPYEEQRWPEWNTLGPVLLVANKSDKCTANTGSDWPEGTIPISAKTGDGMETLFDAIVAAVGADVSVDGSMEIAVSVRHGELLAKAVEALDRLEADLCVGAWELASLGLRDAVGALGRIVGREVEPDVLETIFARFCIGK